MTTFGWLLILIPFVVLGLIVWGVREPVEIPGPRPFDWEADAPLDFR